MSDLAHNLGEGFALVRHEELLCIGKTLKLRRDQKYDMSTRCVRSIADSAPALLFLAGWRLLGQSRLLNRADYLVDTGNSLRRGGVMLSQRGVGSP